MNEQDYYKILVDRYITKKATSEELEVFFKLVSEGKLDKYLQSAFNNHELVNRLEVDLPEKRAYNWKRFAVAASTVVILSIAALLFLLPNKQPHNETARNQPASLNQVSTAAGEQRHVSLPDGSTVLLNAGSSIHYPHQFAGNQRVIQMSGEAYFQVTSNPAIPFRIELRDNSQILVTGTAFTVYSYENEPVGATLLEGEIQVQSTSGQATLRPGQQVVIQKDGRLKVSSADTVQALAWKSGILQFDHANVATVMNRLARWYNVDVNYEGAIPNKQFTGKISVTNSIEEVLQILELSNIRCRVQGTTVTVLQDAK